LVSQYSLTIDILDPKHSYYANMFKLMLVIFAGYTPPSNTPSPGPAAGIAPVNKETLSQVFGLQNEMGKLNKT
jgi:hypothetical protein